MEKSPMEVAQTASEALAGADRRSDQWLLGRLRSGEQTAFDVLFSRHYEPVHRLLARLVGNEADDVCQEVFLRLYRRPPCSMATNLAAWLARVAVNLGYNWLRSRRRGESHQRALAECSGGRGWLSEQSPPEAELERAEEQETVRAALRGLSRKQASLLVLRHSGYRYREIADVLHVAPGSVGTLLARAEEAFVRAYGRAHAVAKGGGGAR